MSASPGALGGLRGLAALRLLLENLGTMVLPSQFTLSKADQKFSENGLINDDKKNEALKSLIEGHIEILKKTFRLALPASFEDAWKVSSTCKLSKAQT